jgi:competence protein ComEA
MIRTQGWPRWRRCFSASLLCLLLTVSVAASAATVESGSAAERPEAVDLNKADLQQLQSLPGVGSAIAQRILDFREANGPFERVEDLLKVRGIGEKSFEKLRPYLRVGRSK